jgi:signal transduction histidine kinase/CheY-like chemotaxis protein
MLRVNIRRSVIIWSAVLCALGWAMNLTYITRLEDSIARDTSHDALLSARLFTNQSDTIIQSIESRLAFVSREIAENRTSLPEAVASGLVSMEHLVLITHMDADGNSVATNEGPVVRSSDFSDREHVAVHLRGTVRGLYIGKPVVGRISDKWSIQLTYPIQSATGQLRGVLVAALDPFYFNRFWSDAYLRSDSFVEMIGGDGILRTSSRELTRQLQDAAPDLEVVQAAKQEEEGSLTVTRMGERFISFFRRSNHYDTITVVRVSEALLQARMNEVRYRYLAGGGILTLFFVLVSGWVISSLRREQITRERAELAETRLSAAIASMPVGFAIFDRTGLLVTQNSSFQEAYASLDRSSAARYADLVEVAQRDAKGMRRGPAEVQPRPGRWARVYEVPTHDGGKICFSVPITDLKQRERDLLASQYMLEANQAHLTSLMQEALAADRMKSRFLAMMSHELRTPLTAVVGFSELLREAEMSEEASIYARQVDECARSLLAIIDDIFDITKIEAQPAKLNRSCVDLHRMLTSLTDVARLLVRSETVAVTLRVASEVPNSIYSDELKIRQCLLNFITNAARHTTSGSIDIFADCRDGMVEINVRDTGLGISAAELPRLFQALDNVTTKRDLSSPGLGLGLAISRRLADILGGSLQATSEPGRGTTITLSLPCSEVPMPGLILGSDAREAGAARVGFRILVADDAPSTRLLLTTMLKKLGHEVTAVEDGVRALDEVRTGRYDVVALDVQMPHMDGTECAREIRALPAALQPAMLIALTAQTFDEDRNRTAMAGFDRFIPKPFTVQDLRSALTDVHQHVNSLSAPS